MPYPDRTSDRSLPSRRSPQQHFRRAHLDNTEDFDGARAQSPSTSTSPQNRRHLGRTGTLRGAFEATRAPIVSEGEDEDNLALFPSYARGTPSPGRKRRMTESTSPQSNPPEKLVQAYRGFGGARDLDYESPEDFEGPMNGLRAGRSSPGGARGYGDNGFQGLPTFADNDASYFNIESPRRESADYINDERRLRRATTSDSPVFSRARAGSGSALTSDNLQRRENDAQEHLFEGNGVDERGPEPSLNLPSTWGSRATNRRDWMRNIGRRSEAEGGEATGDSTKPRIRFDSSTRPPRTTERSPRQSSLGTRSALRERSTSIYNRSAQSDEQNKSASDQKDQQSTGGNISNTPVSVYKNSTFTGRSPAKRDSQDLLRRLSRAESPRVTNQNENDVKTPEPAKPIESHIYDKTPVVTGAWIDTPMTEKVTELPEHLTKDIVTSSKKEPENPPQSQSTETRIDAQPHHDTQANREKERGSARERQAEREREEKQRQEEEQKRERQKKTKLPVIKPELPESGLATYIRDFQANHDSEHPGDDTIESLEMILDEQNEKPTEVKSEAERDEAYEKAIMEKLEHVSSDEANGSANIDMERLNAKLESLVRNIDHIKAGFDGFEDVIKKDADILSRATSPENHKKRHRHTNCENCRAHNDNRFNAYIPLPYLWRRDPISQRVRPTRLGWCTLFFIIWLFSESTMCDYYCHPTYATVCHDNCLNPDAPQFPFVIPIMLWRWSHLSTVLTPLFTLIVAFFRLIAQLLGLWDGYVDDDGSSRSSNLGGDVWIRGTRIGNGVPVAATSSPTTPSQQPWQASNPGLGLERGAAPPPPIPSVQWGDDQASMDDDELL